MIKPRGATIVCTSILIGWVIFASGSETHLAAAATQVSVSGRIVYEDANDVRQPVPGVQVQGCEDDGIFGRACFQDFTNANGEFSLMISDALELDGKFEVYVEAIADSPAAHVGPHQSLFPYCFRTNTSILDSGTAAEFGDLAPLSSSNCGAITAPLTDPRENAGFYVFSQLFRAWEYMSRITQSVNGQPVPKVTARLVPVQDPPDWEASFYALGLITVQPDAWDDASDFGFETLLHEYGHHILTTFAESPLPNYNNGNCDEPDEIWFFQIPDPGHCRWLSEMGAVAWSEGFPTFLAAVIETEVYGTTRILNNGGTFERDGEEYYSQGPEFPATHIVDSATDFLISLISGRVVVEGHTDEDKYLIEGWTTAVLWDLYDPADDDHERDGARDTASMSFEDIWTVVSNYDPAPFDSFHNHPTSLVEFYWGVVSLMSEKISRPRLAGPFLENHIDVPATGFTVVQGISDPSWDASDMYGRGDAFDIIFQICQSSEAELRWEGEAEIGLLLREAVSENPFTEYPAISLPVNSRNVAGNDCSLGKYEFEISLDTPLLGRRFLYGALTDQSHVLEAVLCADPDQLIAEANEEDNCTLPYTLRLQNRPPTLVTNAPSEGYVVDEGGSLFVDLSGSTDPDPRTGQALLFRLYGAGGEIDTPYESVHGAQFTFSAADVPFLADGGAAPTQDSLVMRIRDDSQPMYAAEDIQTVDLTVLNVPPTVFLTNAPDGNLYTVQEGSQLLIKGQLFDPGADTWEVAAYFADEEEATVGMITDVEFNPFLTPAGYHGFFEIRKDWDNETSGKGVDFHVCVTDDDDGTGCTLVGQAQVKVVNVPPTVHLDDPMSAGGTYPALSGSFTDPGADVWSATYQIDDQPISGLSLSPDKEFYISLNPIWGFDPEAIDTIEVCVSDGKATGCQSVAVGGSESDSKQEVDTTLYESGKGPFKIRYPTTWHSNPTAKLLGITAQFEGDSTQRLTIAEENLLESFGGELTLDEYADLSVALMPLMMQGFELLSRTLIKTPEGQEAIILKYIGFIEYPVTAHRLIYIQNGTAFNATFWASPEEFDDLISMVDSSFAAFPTGAKPAPVPRSVATVKPVPTSTPMPTPEQKTRTTAVPVPSQAPAVSPVPRPFDGAGLRSSQAPAPTPAEASNPKPTGSCSNVSSGGGDAATLALFMLPALLLARRWWENVG